MWVCVYLDICLYCLLLPSCVCGTPEQTLNFVAGLLYYIFIIAGDHRQPGGPMANEDAHRVPWKRTCLTHLDGLPIKLGAIAGGHTYWSLYNFLVLI